jgi:cytochrome c peroxidase
VGRASGVASFILVAGAVVCCVALSRHAAPAGKLEAPPGVNPDPVALARRSVQPLSTVAQVGRALFFDQRLSASGREACATCHDPSDAYGPPDDHSVQLGGPAVHDQGHRAVPSLRYLDRVPAFGVGPERGEGTEGAGPAAAPVVAGAGARPRKTAGAGGAVPAQVPRGGLFWDGRASTLQQQAMAPLFNPVEMANSGVAAVAGTLRRAYGARLARLFGAGAIADRGRLIDEAMFAVARFQVEDPSFHPYSSKYDAYLEGTAELSPAEARGLAAFEDPARGNCAACHLDRPGPDGRPPAFTDYEYEALGVPRNERLADNRDPRYVDLGLCGPIRTDLAAQPSTCGMFRTPSLRNVATRHVFFHNGVYHTLEQVLEFYDFRDVAPERVYPRRPDGRVQRFDDLPVVYRGNVDTTDAPFGRRPGAAPPMSAQDMRDIIAFLRTLTDGYRAGR